MLKKKHKVLVVGLPKTGTSTLAVMLRMLGYSVTGPEIKFKGDASYLVNQFEAFDAFQDFPWCFEWKQLINDPRTKVIILKRDEASWWESFYKSYGYKGQRYLSYPYFKLEKNSNNKQQFIDFYRNHYQTFDKLKTENQNKYLCINIKTFEWSELCDFLDEPMPKNIFGKFSNKPHVNKKHGDSKHTNYHKLKVYFRKKIIPIIGMSNWNKIMVILRKNGLV